jgi:hypothetical protein
MGIAVIMTVPDANGMAMMMLTNVRFSKVCQAL